MKVLIIVDETTASENLIEMLKEIDPSIEVCRFWRAFSKR